MNLYATLKKLCLISSPSGREGAVREEISSIISPFVDTVSVDALGNLIALKKSRTEGAKKIMLCAHMDEIGFIVNSIGDDGAVRVGTLGGIRLAAASYTKVISQRGVKGALCALGLPLTDCRRSGSGEDRSKDNRCAKKSLGGGAIKKPRREAARLIAPKAGGKRRPPPTQSHMPQPRPQRQGTQSHTGGGKMAGARRDAFLCIAHNDD